ncbi:unnamed protein product, partial [Scytosiphon promiscuus]
IYLDGYPLCSFPSQQAGSPAAPSGNAQRGPVVAPTPRLPPFLATTAASGGEEALSQAVAYRRLRHPVGEILASSVREYLACPAGGVLSIRLEFSSGVGMDGDRPK